MKPEYHKRHRYPKLNRDASGKPLCRGCQGVVPKGRQTWCSCACYERYGDIIGIKRKVWQRDKGICQLCQNPVPLKRYNSNVWGYSSAEYDHIIPHCEGGMFEVDNLRTVCHECHVKRTTEWRRMRKAKTAVQVELPI